MRNVFLYLSITILFMQPSFVLSEDFDFGEEEEQSEQTALKDDESFSLPLRGKVGFDAGRQVGKDHERWIKLGPSVHLFMDWHGEFGTLYSEGSFFYNRSFQIEKDHQETIDHYEKQALIRELYYKKSFSSWSLTLGRTMTIWGKNDLISILDVASPIDQSELFFCQSRRCSSWSG